VGSEVRLCRPRAERRSQEIGKRGCSGGAGAEQEKCAGRRHYARRWHACGQQATAENTSGY
jgi:hypothetical protein